MNGLGFVGGGNKAADAEGAELLALPKLKPPDPGAELSFFAASPKPAPAKGDCAGVVLAGLPKPKPLELGVGAGLKAEALFVLLAPEPKKLNDLGFSVAAGSFDAWPKVLVAPEALPNVPFEGLPNENALACGCSLA